MKSTSTSLLLAFVLTCFGEASGISSSAMEVQSEGVPVDIARGIGCLIAQDWTKYDLKELGLRIGDTAEAAYQTGRVPGSSLQAANTTSVLLFSARGNRGWLLFFRTESDGSIRAIRNGYQVRHENGEWVASEGNDGAGSYEAMGSFAASLAKRTLITVKLQATADACLVEDGG